MILYCLDEIHYYFVIIELTDCFKKDKEEEKKRKENEKDINMVMSHQGSADAGEQLPENSNEVDDKVTSTTASTTAVVTTTPTKPPITGTSATSAGPSAGWNSMFIVHFNVLVIIPLVYVWICVGYILSSYHENITS